MKRTMKRITQTFYIVLLSLTVFFGGVLSKLPFIGSRGESAKPTGLKVEQGGISLFSVPTVYAEVPGDSAGDTGDASSSSCSDSSGDDDCC